MDLEIDIAFFLSVDHECFDIIYHPSGKWYSMIDFNILAKHQSKIAASRVIRLSMKIHFYKTWYSTDWWYYKMIRLPHWRIDKSAFEFYETSCNITAGSISSRLAYFSVNFKKRRKQKTNLLFLFFFFMNYSFIIILTLIFDHSFDSLYLYL
jgi:ABC-type multidrug transport system permease subunit